MNGIADFQFRNRTNEARKLAFRSAIRNPNSEMIYRRVLRYYRPFLPATAFGLFLSLIGIGVNLLKPWPFKFIVDQILPNDSAFRATHANWHSYIPLLCLAL